VGGENCTRILRNKHLGSDLQTGALEDSGFDALTLPLEVYCKVGMRRIRKDYHCIPYF
jgi:predicted aspartyl protease